MAGHSKWANIQHRKGRQDKLRSKLFSKFSKEITVAAKMGDPDPDKNPRLRLAVKEAKAVSMPKDNIDAAVKRANAKDVDAYSEIVYEGKGPHGVLVVVECATDNSTRTVANVKSYFNKSGGSVVPNGSLEYMFNRKSVFEFELAEGMDLEEMELELIDAGLDEIEEEAAVYKQQMGVGDDIPNEILTGNPPKPSPTEQQK